MKYVCLIKVYKSIKLGFGKKAKNKLYFCFIDELRWNFEIILVSLQMNYVHDNKINYDWIDV